MTTHTDPSTVYPLGRSGAETRRLIQQSGFYNRYTKLLLDEAGVGPGMRVLDLGTGAGDVALIAAAQVGPTGAVVGVDRDLDVLAVARERGVQNGVAHPRAQLTFRQGDVESLPIGAEEPFDAVVGRLVLMYQPDPAAALRRLARCLRPGGVIAFQEFNLTQDSIRCYPPTRLFSQAGVWIRSAFQQAGSETQMGDKLYATFRAAGLAEPSVSLQSPMGGGPDWGGYNYVTAVLRSLLPHILKRGIATADEIDVDTFEARLRAEVVTRGSVVKLPDLVSAWARVP